MQCLNPMNEICEQCLWVGDTGASSHMTSIWEGFTEMEKDDSTATFGAGGIGLKAAGTGVWKGR